MENTKPCSVCKQILLLQDFPNKSSTKSGKASACKPCNQAQKSARYRANLDKNKAYQKQYYEANKSTIIARATKWAKDNPEKQYERNRRWLLSQPGKANVYASNRRAKLKACEVFPISQRFLRKLYSSDCSYCGSHEQITADHVIPVELGGRHSEGNLVPACQSCNSSKGINYLFIWKKKKGLA